MEKEQQFRKSDFMAILIIGEIVAWFSFVVLKNLGLDVKIQEILRLEFGLLSVLVIGVPVCALLALYATFLLGKKISIFFQVGKFVSVGLANTAVDWGIINFLMYIFGMSSGPWFIVFKGISFVGADIHSFVWNKFWTFGRREIKGAGAQFLKFLFVSFIGMGINVSVASVINNIIGPQFNIVPVLWANISVALATCASLIWNFTGYKFLVFRK